jgi:AcrR family transcriptional regulator
VLDVEIRECSAGHERKLILDALVEIVAKKGYAETTIATIVERAGLDRSTFDRHFRSRYDCFLSAWQEINESCMRELLEAYNGEEDWPDRLRAVARGVVEGLLNDLDRASFAIEVLATGDAARARRDMTMRVLASLIDRRRPKRDGGPGVCSPYDRGGPRRRGLWPGLLASRTRPSRGVAGPGSAADGGSRDALFGYGRVAS